MNINKIKLIKYIINECYDKNKFLNLLSLFLQDYLQGCLEQIEEMVSQAVGADGAGGNGHQMTGSSGASQRPLGDEITSQEKILEHEKAGTPTDVRDVHF